MSRERNGKMPGYKQYVAGWLDSSIHDFLEVIPRTSRACAFTLITCLDSELNPKSLWKKSRELRGLMHSARPVGSGLLLPTDVVVGANFRDQVFAGFDEVWFFPSDDIEAKPQSAWIVGPKRIDQSKLDELGEWMVANGCSLGLGDGDGLNIIVKAHGLVKYLLAQSMVQPEPTLQSTGYCKEDTGQE
jgi:hypothetical protein